MTKKEIIRYLQNNNSNSLYQEANRVRKAYCGDKVHIRGIIEFSNYCNKDCSYCGLRRSNKKVVRYRMNIDEIILAATKVLSIGCKTIVLQSGEDSFYKIDDLCNLVEKIKNKFDCAITFSIGERTYQDYKQLRSSGVDRYLLRFETSNKRLFKYLKPDSSYQQRRECLSWLKELGYQTGSGNMIGLPGQTLDILADDILLIEELDLDMVGMGPFIPHPDTPLQNKKLSNLELTLKTYALVRIITKNTHIPATTAVGTIDLGGREKALCCGANVIMPNFTPEEYRKYYEIYPNKLHSNLELKDNFNQINSLIKSLNREVAKNCGHSLKKI